MRRNILTIVLSFGLLSLVTTSCKNPNLSGGILHFDQMRYERARETLLRAIDQEPNNAEAFLWLGKAYAELDSTMESREAFEKARSLADERFPQIGGDVDNALEHYWSARHNEGLQAAKAAQEAKTLGKPADASKDFRAALNKFKRARVFGPDKEETPRNMGVCYFNLGEVDSGLAVLIEAQELAPEGDERTGDLLFDQYRRLGDQAAETAGVHNPAGLADAIKFYTQAATIRQDDADLLFSLGVVYFQLAETDTSLKMERYATAAGYFEKTLTVKPEDQEALQNVANLYLEIGECEKGIERARTLMDLDPHNYRYHDILGRLNDCMGQKSERIAGSAPRALRDGTVQPVDGFRERLETMGAQSDLVRRYREEGRPEEVRTFRDQGGSEYECWFYWTRGRAYAFLNGAYKYATEFKPEKAAEEE